MITWTGLSTRNNATTGISSTIAILSLLFSTFATAHHEIEAKFDTDLPLTLTGIVTGISWENPHIHVFINVGDSSTVPVNWAVEMDSPVELELSGWLADMLATGDSVTVEGIAARDRSDQLWGYRLRRNRDDTYLFSLDENLAAAAVSRQHDGATPRWPDGQPRLGPPPGQTGYWSVPSRSSLIQDGEDVATNRYGLLANLADAARVAPFQDWARDLYVNRQRNFLSDDPGYLYCIPPGGPRHFQLPFPFGLQFVEDRERMRTFILTSGGNRNWRLIYTGGLDNPDQIDIAPNDPLFYGSSTAQWEGDTLVIETGNFNEGFWFSNGGLPHTQMLKLRESITRSDLNTLHYVVAIDDPGAYTRPWTSSWDLQWIAGEEMPEYFCQGNRP